METGDACVSTGSFQEWSPIMRTSDFVAVVTTIVLTIAFKRVRDAFPIVTGELVRVTVSLRTLSLIALIAAVQVAVTLVAGLDTLVVSAGELVHGTVGAVSVVFTVPRPGLGEVTDCSTDQILKYICLIIN